MRVLIIDDEHLATRSLAMLIKRYVPEINTVTECNDPRSGIEIIRSSPIDILFLDVKMPLLNGFEVMEQIMDWNGFIVLTTAYQEHAIKAFRQGVVDYLVKPIDPKELKQAVNRCISLMTNKEQNKNSSLEKQSNSVESAKSKVNLALKLQNKTIFVPLDEILYLKGDRNYTRIHLTKGESIYLSKTLKQFEGLLPCSQFYRLHKTTIVNLQFVKHISTNNIIEMTNGLELPVSKDRKNALIEILNVFKLP